MKIVRGQCGTTEAMEMAKQEAEDRELLDKIARVANEPRLIGKLSAADRHAIQAFYDLGVVQQRKLTDQSRERARGIVDRVLP